MPAGKFGLKIQGYKRQWPNRSHRTDHIEQITSNRSKRTDQNCTFLIKQRATYSEINYRYNLPETDTFTYRRNWNLPSSHQNLYVPLLMHQPAVSDQFCYWIGLHSRTFFACDHGSCQEKLCFELSRSPEVPHVFYLRRIHHQVESLYWNLWYESLVK